MLNNLLTDCWDAELHRESKKGAILSMSILDGFAEFFYCCKEHSISNKPILGYPSHLKYVAVLA